MKGRDEGEGGLIDCSKPAKGLTALDVVFGGGLKIESLMPSMSAIPEEFKNNGNGPWLEWQRRWFFEGLKEFPKAKPGIDLSDATRHLATIQGSFAPKHQHKEAAVAYLASLWLEKPTI